MDIIKKVLIEFVEMKENLIRDLYGNMRNYKGGSMNITRKVRRNKLKKELGTNKIKEAFHDRYDTLEQKIRKELKKNAKNN